MTLVISSTFLFARPKVPSCVVVSASSYVWSRWVAGCKGGRLRGCVVGETYPLLREATGTLVLGVAEEFNDALLVGGKAVESLAKSSLCAGLEAAAAGCAFCAFRCAGP